MRPEGGARGGKRGLPTLFVWITGTKGSRCYLKFKLHHPPSCVVHGDRELQTLFEIQIAPPPPLCVGHGGEGSKCHLEVRLQQAQRRQRVLCFPRGGEAKGVCCAKGRYGKAKGVCRLNGEQGKAKGVCLQGGGLGLLCQWEAKGNNGGLPPEGKARGSKGGLPPEGGGCVL